MDFLRDKKYLIFLEICFFIFLFIIDPAHPLIHPPDPFESRDGFAMLGSAPPPPDGTLIFGPVTFMREREAPKTEQVAFTISDATGSFLLRLTKGALCGPKWATSASVKLNGSEVFRPSEFRQNVAELRRQVALLSGENLLEVRLRAAPGSFITLELFHLDRQACSVLDPHIFERGKRKPSEETLEFELGPQFFGPFMLHLTNGTADGYHRVDSAKIKLNGRLVLGPHVFNENVEEVFRVVSLRSKNRLSVELRGAPRDFLTLGIVGYDHTPPVVTITSPLNGAVFNAGPIPVSGTVDDSSSSVTVNGITAQVGPEGSFTAEEITLVEGENVIRVVATDRCGNQGEDQILVYLRTVPQGPYLLFCPDLFYETRPDPPEPGCSQQIYEKYVGTVTGLTDETAVSVRVNGVLFPVGEEVSNQGDIDYGFWDGTFFWAFVNIPQEDGTHPFTAVVTNAEGGQTEATVYFIVDNVPPGLAVTTPGDEMITNTPTITVTGTVDDPDAMVRVGSYGSWIPVVDGTFTTTFILRYEGSNYLRISARDPAENYSFVSRTIILDTQPPQINVTYPAEGKAVNTSALNVTGSIIDQNINEVTVSVNGSQAQALTLTGTNFSGVANLVPGQNTLVFQATDKAGNTASGAWSVLLDVEAPAVAIRAPLSGAILSGTTTVTVESSDGTSGIASISLFVDDQLHDTLSVPPFDFSLDTSMLTSGVHTITVRAVDRAGNQAEAAIAITVIEFARVEITSPVNGATVNKASAIVQGRIYNQTGEIGVAVNGVLAEVQGGEFAVVVPLQQGENTITCIATWPDGAQAQAQITINTEAQEEFVRLNATPTSGVLDQTGILSVTFEAEAYLPNPVSGYSWDFDGDGMDEVTGPEARVAASYQSPGIYFPRVTVTDSQGNAYTEDILVNILSRQEVDILLKSKWEGMKTGLFNKDIPTALNYFVDSSREVYQQAFSIIMDELPQISSNMEEIEMVFLSNNNAKYRINRLHYIDGTYQSVTYYIYFVKDLDGLWRIDRF
ncbi:MAG: Ig-like domain-containing protein [Thermodesulfobacteriota bacterium]